MKYRTFWKRFWAGFIDGLVFLPMGFLDGLLMAPERGNAVLISWAIFSYSSCWIYSVWLHARFGQTVGKMVMRVTVLDLGEERRPSLYQAFLRDIGYIALNLLFLGYVLYLISKGQYRHGAEESTAIGQLLAWSGAAWFLLEIVSMTTNEKRRALHDYIAGTVVTRNA
ncbi:MAG: hypothetical protein JWM57_1287 [Phycisphaerales bacterium]|nr:hypothetical protein [Phycisphaerales bacterium]